MTTLLIVLFALSLIYFTISERFRTYSWLVGFQGLLLFGISYFELDHVNTLNLLFIFAETIFFKTIVVPWQLNRIISLTNDTRIHRNTLPGYYTVILASLLLVVSYIIGNILKTPVIDRIYLTVSLFAMFTAMLFIITRKKIFSHLIGFLILENAVFLLSLAIGNEMPMLINTGILLDIFISVLILGTFMTKIGSEIHTLEAENLTRLKD
jgi:Hydrogenase 4 membrane component (E)